MIQMFVLGDKSRYQFLRRLGVSFTTEDAAAKRFTLYNSTIGAKLQDDALPCPLVPLNTSLVFPSESRQESLSVWDTVLFFDEFPFRTDYKIGLLSTLRESKSTPRIRIVLCRNDRTFLHSDISTEAEAWEEANKQYRKEGYEVFSYSDGEKTMPFLFGGATAMFRPRLLDEYKNKIAAVRESVELMFGIDYEMMYVGELALIVENPSFLERFTAYTKYLDADVPGEVYKQAMLRDLFENETEFEKILSPLFSLYRNTMKPVCVWDVSGDKKQLAKKITASFKKSVKTGKQNVFTGNSKSDYLLYLKDNHDDVHFKTKCETFFKTVQQDVMKKFMLDKLEKLEELIHE